MKCPICKTAKPECVITANDGGSILCPGCRSLYHECRDGITRAGYSPLTCEHCGYIRGDHIDFELGTYEVSKGSY